VYINTAQLLKFYVKWSLNLELSIPENPIFVSFKDIPAKEDKYYHINVIAAPKGQSEPSELILTIFRISTDFAPPEFGDDNSRSGGQKKG